MLTFGGFLTDAKAIAIADAGEYRFDIIRGHTIAVLRGGL